MIGLYFPSWEDVWRPTADNPRRLKAGIDQEDIVAASQAAPEEDEDRGVGTVDGRALKIRQSQHRSTNTHWIIWCTLILPSGEQT